jgi:glycosyltransferase involved in cell wall biosynthesis
MNKKRMGVDAFPLCKLNGGIGYYIFHLLDELIQLRSEWEFLLYAPSENGDIEHFKRYKNVVIRVIPQRSQSHSLRSLLGIAFFAYIDRVDVFWGTTQILPLFKRKKMKTILTVHDFVYLLFPQTMTTSKRLFFKVFGDFFLKTTDAIMPISYATGDRLFQLYGLKYHSVVYPPLKPQIVFKEEKQVLEKISTDLVYNGYVVTVGTLEPRKNFITLIEKYVQILQSNSLDEVLPLVIIGGGGWKNQMILKVLQEARSKYPNHVKLLGYISDELLSYYLSGAKYYITLSVYEGYGMPLAEARTCRTPVACFDSPEMREAAENSGIFLRMETLDNDLTKVFLSKEGLKESKKPFSVNYKSNVDGAKRISSIIEEVTKS